MEEGISQHVTDLDLGLGVEMQIVCIYIWEIDCKLTFPYFF